MTDVLPLCRDFPELQLGAGAELIAEGVRTDRLYVLKSGAFEVVRNGVRVALVNEPGAFLGEIAAVLGTTPTASVLATQDSVVHVIDAAEATVRTRPDLTFAIAQLLGRRLAAVTGYLVDLKRQYADSGTHLGLMDQVLGNLVSMQPLRGRTGSERTDQPDY